MENRKGKDDAGRARGSSDSVRADETDFSKMLIKLFTLIIDEEIARSQKQNHIRPDPSNIGMPSPPPLFPKSLDSNSPPLTKTPLYSTSSNSERNALQTSNSLFDNFPSYGNRHCDMITNKIKQVNEITLHKMCEIYDNRLVKETELHNKLMTDLSRIVKQGEDKLNKLVEKLNKKEQEQYNQNRN